MRATRHRLALSCVAFASLIGCGVAVDQRTGPSPTGRPDFGQSRDEFLLLVRECIEDHGFAVTLGPDGGFNFAELSSREQLDEARGVSRACVEEVDPARLDPLPPLSGAQLIEMHDYALAQAECLREAGYPVGPAPPLQVYVDTEGAWDPYVDLAERGMPPDAEDVVACQDIEEQPKFLEE